MSNNMFSHPKRVVGDTGFTTGVIPKFKTAEAFAETKINMLKNQFCIKLSDEDAAHLRSLTTESEINNCVRKMISKYWG